MGGLLDRIDQWQRRHAWSAFGFGVVKKFGDDQSGNLAALVAYYAFFSVFPLLLALRTTLDFVLSGHPAWVRSIETNGLNQLPLVGNVNAHLTGNVVVLVMGVLLAMYSGLGVGKTAQSAFDTVNLVAKADRPNFLMSTVRSLSNI